MLFTVLLVMDPIGMIPQYISVTSAFDQKTRNSIIAKAVLIASVVLIIFLLSGKFLLDFFGIMPGTFYISGGILFFGIALEMIYNKPRARNTPVQEQDKMASASVAMFPLAVPLMAGPGLLTVIIMYMSNGNNWFYSFSLLLPAIIIALAVTFIVLKGSNLVLRVIGTIGIFVVEKIMGLILGGFSVQFIYNGLLSLGIIGK